MIGEEPTTAEGFNARGNRYSRNGAYQEALENYARAIELDPGFAEAYYNRGVSYYELGRHAEAIADLSRAIDLNPVDDSAYGRRSLVYLFSDQLELAQADEEMCEELRHLRAAE